MVHGLGLGWRILGSVMRQELKVWGSAFRIWGLEFGLQVYGSGFGVQCLGFRVWGSGFGVQGLGFGVWLSGFWVLGSGFRVYGSGFRVQALVFRI
jgi:hypothetical protein